MVRFTSLLTLGLPLLASAASQVVNLIPDNFDKIVFESNKPALVEFFAPWCGHCKNLAPVYDELAASFASAGDKVTIASVDADEHRSLGQRFGVQGFPTIKWFDGKPGSKPEDYNGGRDLESLQNFIKSKSGAKAKTPKKAESKVKMLTDSSFKEVVGSDKAVLVAFTAPWCGHCKTLAPVYELLANDFASESGIVIAKVDAEADNSKATAKSQEVTSYPTIKFFPAGSTEAEPYAGGRTQDSFVSFINSKIGTHRVVGGALSATAGTIEALDTILAKYVTGKGFSDIETATEEIKKAAEAVTDKTKEYYLKALAKITGNPEYAMKEQTRLAGLLKKGGLAPEKIDDLQRRSNILARFLVKEPSKDEL